MKRMILMLVAMVSMTATFAENEETASLHTTEAYNMTVNMNKLGMALNLSKDQVEGVEEIHKTFCAEMMFAAQYGKDECAKRVDKAIAKDLLYMSYILNNDQMRKYRMLLNVTLVNRGIK